MTKMSMNKTEITNNQIECQECGSQNILADHLGYYVCSNCGMTLDEQFYETQPAFLHTRNHERITSTQPLLEMGTSLGKSSERTYKFTRLQSYQVRSVDRIDRLMVDFKYLIKAMKGTFHVTLNDELFVNLFHRYYSQLPSGTKSRNMKLFSSCIFVQVCRESNVSINVKDVLATYEISIKDYFATQQILSSKAPLNYNFKNSHQMDRQIIQRFVAENHLGETILTETTQFLESEYAKLGTKPTIRACTALSLVLRKHPEITLRTYHIAEALNVSISRIYAIVNLFDDAKSEKLVKIPKAPSVAKDRNVVSAEKVTIISPALRIDSHIDGQSVSSLHSTMSTMVAILKAKTSAKTSNHLQSPKINTSYSHRIEMVSKTGSNRQNQHNLTILDHETLSSKTSRTQSHSYDMDPNHHVAKRNMRTRNHLEAISKYFHFRCTDGPPHHLTCRQIIGLLQQEDQKWKT